LRTGDRLHTRAGTDTATVHDTRTRTELTKVYNLTIDGIHKYYVHAGNMPVLVHNSGGPAPVPVVVDPKLQSFVIALYEGVGNPNLVGDGTAMAAANSETLGANAVEGKNHVGNAAQYRTGLNRWLSNNPSASEADRQVARSLVKAIDDAHAGRYGGFAKYSGLMECP
jgi:hypothetical protein